MRASVRLIVILALLALPGCSGLTIYPVVTVYPATYNGYHRHPVYAHPPVIYRAVPRPCCLHYRPYPYRHFR